MLCRVVAIGDGNKFLERSAPGESGVVAVELLGAVEFAAILALEEEQVELAIVVGSGSLLGMAHAGCDGKGPNEPLVLHEESA